jgi:zinc transport system substrate-binding protein
VSIQPQRYFVQQIGGDHVAVEVMVAPGASPATYEPKPRQMAALTEARLYFAIGVPFEAAWLDKIAAANPAMRVVPTDRGIRKLPMAAHRHTAAEPHGHDDHGHAHGIPDPHIWLAPPLVKHQAQTICEALQAADPAHSAQYAANLRRFVADIEALDRALRAMFEGKAGQQFMVFHPSWGYFAAAYDLEQVPVEIEGKDPKPAQLQALIEHAREREIRVIFVQPQFSTRSAELLAREIDGRAVFADPLAADWAANLKAVAAQVAAALR